MRENISQQIAESVANGHEPAGIVMSSRQLTRFLREAREASNGLLPVDDHQCSGWAFRGLPIYRSYEISGPCVVSRDVLDVLRKCGRWASVGASRGPMQQVLGSQACEAALHPLLF